MLWQASADNNNNNNNTNILNMVHNVCKQTEPEAAKKMTEVKCIRE